MSTLSEQVSAAVGVLGSASDKAKMMVESDSIISTESGDRSSLPKVIREAEEEFKKRLTGMAYARVGTFTSGYDSLVDARQTLEYDGRDYGWAGEFPKKVFPNSSPSGSGGISAGAWIDRTEDKLRSEVRETTFKLLKRVAAEAGLNLVEGSFEEGALTINSNDVVWFQAGGTFHGGVIGSVVAGSFPSSSWIDKSNETLKSMLASDGGVEHVNGALKKSNLGLNPIYNASSYSNSNIYQSWKDSVLEHGYVYLSGGGSTQYTLVGTHTDLYGSTVIADNGVTLVVPDDQYPLLGSIKVVGDLHIKTASLNTTFSTASIDKVPTVAKLKSNLLKSSAINFDDCYAASVLSDTYTDVIKGSASSSAILIPLTIGSCTGLFVPISAGEAISAHQRVESGSAASFGVLLRCVSGWIKVTTSPGSTTYNISYKQQGGGVVSSGTFTPADTELLSYAAGKASIGVSLSSSTEFYFLVNGTSKTKIKSGLGDILDVGFIFDDVSATSTGRVTGLCCYKAEKTLYGYGPINIAIYGDSTADDYAGSFDKYLPQLLDGENASRSVAITNHAIAGQTFQQQFDLLQANGPENAYIICMVAGTNDIQAGVSADDFVLKVTAFIDYCESNGRIPMLVEPWMWYPKSSIGGDGQASSNYQNGSELREASKRVALSRGAIYVSTTHELPAPIPEYFGSSIDPLLRDDIHQSKLGYRLYAELIASHIVEFMGRITKTGISVPLMWKTSVVSSIASSHVTENGIAGSFAVSGFSNGAAIINLPRWCRPPRTITAPAAFTTSGGSLSSCYVVITTSGAITVNGLTQTSSTIVLDVRW